MKNHLNPNVRGLLPSVTVAINDRSNELLRQGKNIYKLGLGQSPFPVQPSVVAALQENAHQKDYLPVKGLADLREAIAAHHCRSLGIECTADDVLIGPGSKELMFLLQLSYFGDLVIPAPTWVSYAPQAKIIGRWIHLIQTRMEDNWHLTADQLQELCRKDPGRPRILIINYPSNPTGLTLNEDRLRELAEVARKYDVVLLSDEIYGKLHHQGEHRSIVPLYPEGTIFSGGMSKWCGAGGWRLGLFVFPRRLRWLLDAMAAVASETYTSTSAPIQHAAVTAFREGPEIDRYVAHSQRILAALGKVLHQRLAEVGVRVLPPEGGFYLFPDFSLFREKLRARGIENSRDMCLRLLDETGVALLPGSAFGRDPDELTARIAYVDFDGAAALAGAEAVPPDEPLDEAFVVQNCGRLVEAVERIGEWMDGSD